MPVLFLLAALAAPVPSPTPLRTITNVRVRAMCTVLRENVKPALRGMIANDELAAEGQQILNRLGLEAQTEYAGDLGGAGPGNAMDNVRTGSIVSGLVANIEKIEKLLDENRYGVGESADSASLAAVRARLQDVLTQQKAELNTLSFVAYSNDGNDVLQRKSPIGLAHEPPPPSLMKQAQPLTLPDMLLEQRKAVNEVERQASDALAPVIAACR